MAGAHARTLLRHVQVFRFLHVLCITSRQCLEGAGRTQQESRSLQRARRYRASMLSPDTVR